MRVDWRSSVRARVTIGASLVLVLALTVAALAAAGLVRRSLTADSQAELVDRVDEVETLIQYDSLDPVLDPTGHEIGQVQVVDSLGNVIAATPGFATTSNLAAIPAPPVGETRTATVDGSAIEYQPGQDFRIVVWTVMSSAGPLTIYAATSLKAADRAENYLRNSLLVGLPFLILLAAWLMYVAMGRALAPVDAMRIAVDKIEATDLSGRVSTSASDDEIAKLGATLNRMLDRLADAADRQEIFAASAAHELRSPLSAIRTELEVGLNYPERAEWPTIARDSLIEVERLEALARDLRVLTRVRHAPAPNTQPCDLAELVNEELAKRRPTHEVTYHTNLAPSPVMAEHDAVVRVVRNLFDNAERHAAHTITVDLGPDGNGATLTVVNDGPPIPEDECERIFEPFTRLEEARSVDTGGSGLGLAIARSTMRAHNGTLVAVHRDDAAEFRAWFPSGSNRAD